jgi:uncharacterized protein (DUF3820 family)
MWSVQYDDLDNEMLEVLPLSRASFLLQLCALQALPMAVGQLPPATKQVPTDTIDYRDVLLHVDTITGVNPDLAVEEVRECFSKLEHTPFAKLCELVPIRREQLPCDTHAPRFIDILCRLSAETGHDPVMLETYLRWMHPARARFYATKMPFGEHQGTPLSKLPPDYLAWIVEHGDVDGDLGVSLLELHWMSRAEHVFRLIPGRRIIRPSLLLSEARQFEDAIDDDDAIDGAVPCIMCKRPTSSGSVIFASASWDFFLVCIVCDDCNHGRRFCRTDSYALKFDDHSTLMYPDVL